jgi:hypothetical protein
MRERPFNLKYYGRSLVAFVVARPLRARFQANLAREGPSIFGSLARGAAAGRGVSPGSADDSYLSAASATTKELIAAIGLEPRHAYSGRHLESLQHFSCLRIDSPQIALVTFPGAVPEFFLDPGDPGHEAVGLDGAKNRPCLGSI